jgi:putative ABC transport system substrate-binding protein
MPSFNKVCFVAAALACAVTWVNPTLALPVLQSTKFVFVINMQAARALGIEVPNSIQLLADELIE